MSAALVAKLCGRCYALFLVGSSRARPSCSVPGLSVGCTGVSAGRAVARPVAGRHDARPLEHEDHGPLRRPRPVNDTSRDGEPLPGQELNATAFLFEVDEEAPVHHIEELVLLIVVLPVEFPLHDAKSDDAVVYAAERLIVPSIFDPPASFRTSTSSRKPNASSRLIV